MYFPCRSKKWWLMTSLTILCLTCLLATITSLQMMFSLVCLLFLLNLGSAGQDICVDSLALEALETDELGIGNTIQVGWSGQSGNNYELTSTVIRLWPTRLVQSSLELPCSG